MFAEVISIGDEITSGQLLDTNSQWLSQRLEELGVRVLFHSTIGDELSPITDAFRVAIGRADIVLCTGGLGPTADDLTRQGLAQALKRELVVDDQALEHIRQLFARRKRPMPPQNESQAFFPLGSRVIPNPNGTAPGIAVEVSRDDGSSCRVFVLPGVPAEMREMWRQTVAEAVRQAGADGRIVRHYRLKCFGAGESQIEAMLPDLIRRGRTPRVGINASGATIILRITAEGADEAECRRIAQPTVDTIRQCLGPLVFGEEDDELQDAVLALLRESRRTLAVGEWGTGGLVADWLAGARQSEGCFLGGVVVQVAQALDSLLDPARQSLLPPGDDAELVEAMAIACRERFRADFGLAVGPFPPPQDAASEPRPVHFALATGQGVSRKAIPFAAHPAILRVYCGKQALDMLRRHLLKVSESRSSRG